ncbi:MAG: DUF554 domain-containing protein [Propioniciclava sp.]
MESMFIGAGTVVNVGTVVVGALLGLLLGHRIPERTRNTVTDVLGLMTVVMGVMSAFSLTGTAFVDAVGSAATTLVVLGSLIVGALAGSALGIERRMESGVERLRNRFSGPGDVGSFVDAVVAPSLLFCVGPLTILGTLSDGLGLGADQLLLKSMLDGFAALAFAASLGWPVLLSAVVVGIVQGSLTVSAHLAGTLISDAQIEALTATGGVMLIALGLRLLRIRQIPVGDLLPALIVAPATVTVIQALG